MHIVLYIASTALIIVCYRHCPTDTAVIFFSCGLFAAIAVTDASCKPFASVPQALLQGLSPVAAADSSPYCQNSSMSFADYLQFSHPLVVRDKEFGITTPCGLDDPAIESRRRRDVPHPSRTALAHSQPPIQWIQALFPGGKAAGAWRQPPTPI